MKRERLQRSDVPHWLVRGIALFCEGRSARECARLLCFLLPYVHRGEHPARWPTVGDGGVSLWLKCRAKHAWAVSRPPQQRERATLDVGRKVYDRVTTQTPDERAYALLDLFVRMGFDRRDDLREADETVRAALERGR